MTTTKTVKTLTTALVSLVAMTFMSAGHTQNRAQYSGHLTGKYFKMPKFNGWNIASSMNGSCELIEATKASSDGQFVSISICPKGRRDAAMTTSEATPILNGKMRAEAARLDVSGCKKSWGAAYQSNFAQAKGFQMIQQCGESPNPYTTGRVGIYSLADLEIQTANRFAFPAPKDGIAEGTELVYHFQLK